MKDYQLSNLTTWRESAWAWSLTWNSTAGLATSDVSSTKILVLENGITYRNVGSFLQKDKRSPSTFKNLWQIINSVWQKIVYARCGRILMFLEIEKFSLCGNLWESPLLSKSWWGAASQAKSLQTNVWTDSFQVNFVMNVIVWISNMQGLSAS